MTEPTPTERAIEYCHDHEDDEAAEAAGGGPILIEKIRELIAKNASGDYSAADVVSDLCELFPEEPTP